MDWRTTCKKVFPIAVIIAIFAFVVCAAIYAGEASQAESESRVAQSNLENVIKDQREKAKLHPEDTNIKRLDFLDIVEKEQEYNQALVDMLSDILSASKWFALAAFLLAVLGFREAFSPGAVKESFKEFKGWFKKRTPKNWQSYRNQGQLKSNHVLRKNHHTGNFSRICAPLGG